jgi:hypothetical protein
MIISGISRKDKKCAQCGQVIHKGAPQIIFEGGFGSARIRRCYCPKCIQDILNSVPKPLKIEKGVENGNN